MVWDRGTCLVYGLVNFDLRDGRKFGSVLGDDRHAENWLVISGRLELEKFASHNFFGCD